MGIISPSRRSLGLMSLRYGAGLSFDVLKLTFLVLLGAEAVFLSDVVISNLLPEVLDHQAGFLSLLSLIAFTIPGVLVIALPLAVLVGSYLVIMNRRQAAEFAVIAGVGLSSRALISLTALIGFGALAVSHTLSGFVEPLARYQLSETLFEVRYDAIREGRIAPGEFYQMGNFAVFTSSGQINETASKLFVHERIDQATNRIIMADRVVRLRDPQVSGIGVLLQDAAIYEFETNDVSRAQSTAEPLCVDCAEQPDTNALQVMLSDRMFVQLQEEDLPFQESDLPALRERGSKISELTNLELLRLDSFDRTSTTALAERLLRDLLCFFAPLIGLLSAALTTARTYLFALPTACSVVLTAQFLGSYGVKSLAGLGLFGALVSLATLALVLAVLVAIVISRRERGFISPLGSRV